MHSSEKIRRAGTFAIIAGIVGLIGVGLLIAALFAPTPSPNTMRRETNFFLWHDAFVILQAAAMIPVTLVLYRLSSDSSGKGGKTLALGLIAQISLIVSTALIFTNTASDMLYMVPVGLVGLWLLLVNRSSVSVMSSTGTWTGRVAGFGLLLVGMGFLIYGALVAPAVFVRPLSIAEVDAQTLTPANLISHLLLAAGTLLGRLIYPIWTLSLGAHLLRLDTTVPSETLAVR